MAYHHTAAPNGQPVDVVVAEHPRPDSPALVVVLLDGEVAFTAEWDAARRQIQCWAYDGPNTDATPPAFAAAWPTPD
jgi:hypothetical protein